MDEARSEARTLIGRLAHFLDIPLFSVIVFCGVVRPDSWLQVGGAISIAIAVALVLMYVVPHFAESIGAHSPGPSP